MCSITINKTADDILTALNENERKMIETRLINFAQQASVQMRGGLDIAPMKRMPDDLKLARKKRIGRHRVYYTGFHTQCSYETFFIKVNKRKGVNDEDDRGFQRALLRAIDDPQYRELARLD